MLWSSYKSPSGAIKAVDKSRKSQHQRATNAAGPPCRVQLEGAINTAVGQEATGLASRDPVPGEMPKHHTSLSSRGGVSAPLDQVTPEVTGESIQFSKRK